MSSKPHYTEPGQVICNFFNITTRVKSVALKEDELFIEAPKSDMAFNPFELWNFMENPSARIEEKGLILLRAAAHKPDSVVFTSTLLFKKILPEPCIESIRFALITAPFPSQKDDIIRELKAVWVFHLLEPPYVADIKDGILITWPLDYEGEDFLTKVTKHQQPPAKPKPKRTSKTRTQPDPPPGTKPKPAKPDRRKKKKAPLDVLKYFSWLAPKSKWRVVFKAMYDQGFYEDIAKNKFYQGKKSRKGRFYTWGVKRLVNVTGLSYITVRRSIALILKHKIIRRWKGGFPGQGNSFYELPLDMSHVISWKREYKDWIKPAGKR